MVLIDYQPSQFATVRSMDPELLLKNIVSTVKTAKTFGLPILLSTVNVASGQGKPTVPELAELLEDSPPIDRTSINSWEDVDFVAAVRATGRRLMPSGRSSFRSPANSSPSARHARSCLVSSSAWEDVCRRRPSCSQPIPKCFAPAASRPARARHYGRWRNGSSTDA